MIEQQEKIVKETLATYMVLPMLQLNKSSYGVGNFMNCYVDMNGYVVVDVKDTNSVNEKNTFNHADYVTDYEIEFENFPDNVRPGVRIVYSVPDEYKHDLRLFQEGTYSQFSGALKVAISKYSLLSVNDSVIKSLNPQKEDRQMIADDLGVRVDLVKEIKSAPNSNNFIKIK